MLGMDGGEEENLQTPREAKLIMGGRARPGGCSAETHAVAVLLGKGPKPVILLREKHYSRPWHLPMTERPQPSLPPISQRTVCLRGSAPALCLSLSESQIRRLKSRIE